MKNNIIDIICPLYNAENYVEKIHDYISMQKNVNIGNIIFALTRSTDNTEKLLKKISKNDKRVKYTVVEKEDFSHSLVRERPAMESKSDALVFITQDIVVEDDMWLYYLTLPIFNNEAESTYARQITKYNNIEKYTREFNYPEESFIKTKDDIPKMGLKTFFNSDACSSIKTSIFHELNGYDGKDMPVNEDMYFSYKLIMNGYRIRYTAESVVYHSHKLSLKRMYNRYKQIGKFFKQNSYLDQYGTIKSGGSMAKYVIKRIIQEKRFILLFRYPLDMSARLLGMRAGKR
jgi:rhamnosyltransferase